MLHIDEDALICDLAETYHIHDYTAFPVGYIATLAMGLPEASRIKRKLSGMTLDLQNTLIARCLDVLNLLFWAQTKAGQKNQGRPKSVLSAMTAPTARAAKDDLRGYASGKDFMEARQKLVKGG